MEMPLKELVDKYTILKLKKDHGADVQNELHEIQKDIPVIDPELIEELYKINAKMWDYEAEVGRLAMELRKWNLKRIAAKNKIAERYGGFKEVKTYYADSSDL